MPRESVAVEVRCAKASPQLISSQPQNRAEGVGGVLIGVPLDEVPGGPAGVAILVPEPVVDAIVGMGAMTVDHLAEQARANHVEDGEIVAAEAPVFEHHARHFGAFVRVEPVANTGHR